jgi:GT2 family glycosyltransferase
MLYFYSTRKKNLKIFSNVKKSFKKINDVKIYEFINDGQYSLTSAYNKALDMASEDEIVVLAHDDIDLEYGWDEKLRDIFEKTDYGIIGLAGTANLPETGIWWQDKLSLAGVVWHRQKKENAIIKYDTRFSQRQPYIMDVCVLDGLFIAFKKNRIKKRFNELISGYHFYDISFCIDNFIEGVKIGVTTSFDILHDSIGTLTQSWYFNQKLFLSSYKDKLPLTVNVNQEKLHEKREVSFEQDYHVGVIMLTKDKIDYVSKAVNSLIHKTSDKIKLSIIIGDTGSNEESLAELNILAVQHPDIIKIEHLPFYNFAKNNNYIYKKYFQEDNKIKHILFSNNDICLINNALDLMLYEFIDKKNVGTVGCKMLFDNNKIQHGGITLYVKNNSLHGVHHTGYNSYYGAKSARQQDVFGNTGAFLLIDKNIFEDCDLFDERTTECFEDVILNVKCILQNKINIFVGDALIYHYESLTRNEDEEKDKRIKKDSTEILFPLLSENSDKLKKYAVQTK